MNLLELAHNLKKFVTGTEGNVSEKISNEKFLIKASGTSLSNLIEKNLILCNFNNIQLDNFEKKPSMEFEFHSSLLKHENINFIAHTHPTNTLSIVCSNLIYEFAESRFFPDQIVFNDIKSCVIPYAKPGNELNKNIDIYLNKFISLEGFVPKLILLQNHGIICASFSARGCLMATEICEKSAEIFIKSKLLGNINYISQSEIYKINFDENEIYRKDIINK